MDNYKSSNYGHTGEPIWNIRNRLRKVSFDVDALQEFGGLATVPLISPFTTDGFFTVASTLGDGRRVDPAVMPVLVNAMPNIREMEWAFFSLPWRLPDLRMSLANALFSTAAADIAYLLGGRRSAQ
jgi:hypothetical protein